MSQADAITDELMEIDENLMRSELTPTQEAEHLQRRKEIWEAMETAKSSRSFEGRGNEGFAKATESATGTSKRTTQQATRRAREVCQAARDLIRGTALDKGTILDALARIDGDDEQVEGTL